MNERKAEGTVTQELQLKAVTEELEVKTETVGSGLWERLRFFWARRHDFSHIRALLFLY